MPYKYNISSNQKIEPVVSLAQQFIGDLNTDKIKFNQ